MKALTSLLGNRWVVGTLVVLLLALLVCFAGPYVAFADVKPFESLVARLVTVLIIVIAWAVILLLQQVRAARTDKQLAGAVAGGEQKGGSGAAAAGATSGDEAALRTRFEEASALLRKQSRGNTRGLYQLPWYVIIGPPGSGKTTALLKSGLHFPLAGEASNPSLRGVGGTRNCDWWIADQAVLIDTAGRYTTQDSDPDADSAGWRAFLRLLARYRPRRPINGVLVAFSAPDLMQQTDEQRARHVRDIRARLAEIASELNVNLPVYFLLTKCDLVAGFNEFFDDLDRQARSQVWGVTFPLELSREGGAVDRLATEIDLLLGKLDARLMARLAAERDVNRRAAMFAFPHQMAGLRGRLTSFCKDVFANAPGNGKLALRGVYFTSGTQEGTPIDRMMSAVARSFGLALPAAAATRGVGKTFFIERLLREVVFAEAGLAGTNRRAEMRSLLLNAGAYALVGLAVLGGVFALTMSYRSNAAYIDSVTQSAGFLESPTGQGLEGRLPRLDSLNAVVAAAQQFKDDVPLRMRFGLYQGNAISEIARDAYLREINAFLTPDLARSFEARMAALVADPSVLYQYLKAYLMLGEPKRLDARHVAMVAAREWQETYRDDPVMRQTLETHLGALLAEPDRVTAVTTSSELIEQSRISLAQASLPVLIYSRVSSEYSADTRRALNLASELGLGAEKVMHRRSGVPLDQPVPALYTRAVFDEFDRTGKLEAVRAFVADAWVLGDRAPSVTQTPRLAYEVQQIYERDYIRAWNELLSDLTFRSATDAQDASNLLAFLGSPTSPLKRLIVLVDAQTNFSKPAAGVEGVANAVADKAEGALGAIPGFSGAPAAKPGEAITAAFKGYHKLLEGPPGAAPIDQLLTSLAAARTAVAGGGAGAVDVNAAAGLQALQIVAAQLPPAMSAAVAELGKRTTAAVAGGVRTQLSGLYNTQVVGTCRDLISNRFPFQPGSSEDVALADFGTVFGTGGVFDTFFQSTLAPLVDTTRVSWQWRPQAVEAGAGGVSLAQFQAAARVREVFFASGGRKPEFSFTLLPDYLDAGSLRFILEIDGQQLDYRHGQPRSIPVTWPGNGAGQASIAFEDASGARPNLAFRGPWAWFRLLDQADIRAQSPTRFLVTFRIGAREARVILDAASARNPLSMPQYRRFRCD